MAIFKCFKSNIFLIQLQNREKIKPHTSTKKGISINTIKGVVDKGIEYTNLDFLRGSYIQILCALVLKKRLIK